MNEFIDELHIDSLCIQSARAGGGMDYSQKRKKRSPQKEDENWLTFQNKKRGKRKASRSSRRSRLLLVLLLIFAGSWYRHVVVTVIVVATAWCCVSSIKHFLYRLNLISTKRTIRVLYGVETAITHHVSTWYTHGGFLRF